MTVTQNGSSRICKSHDSLTLKEGANTVSVTVRFRDGKYNQIDASTKVYTIYYFPDHDVQLEVKNARSGAYIYDQDQLTVMQDSLWIQVRARKASGGTISDVSVRVRLNNKTESRFRRNLPDETYPGKQPGEGDRGRRRKQSEDRLLYREL